MEEHTRAEIEEGGAEAEDTTIAESAAQIDVEAAAVECMEASPLEVVDEVELEAAVHAEHSGDSPSEDDAAAARSVAATMISPAECSEALAAAEAQMAAGQFDAATESFRGALASLRGFEEAVPLEWQALELQLLDGVAASHAAAGRHREALDVYIESMSTANSYGLTQDEANACLFVADTYAEMASSHPNALDRATLVLKRSENVDERVLSGGVGGTKCGRLHNMLQLEELELDLEEAPAALSDFLRRPAAQDFQRVTKDKCFGSDLTVLESIQWFERMADIAAAGGHPTQRAQALGSLGTVYAKLQQPAIAARFFQGVLSYGQGSGDNKAVANASFALGSVFDTMALKLCLSSRQAFEAVQSKAIGAYEEARAAWSALGDEKEVVQCYMRIANGYALLRNNHEAIAKLRFAEEMAKRGGDAKVRAAAMREMGLQYQVMSQHRNALAAHEMDFKIQEKTKNRSGMGVASCNLGISKRSLGSFKEALKLVDFALQVAEEEQDLEAQTRSLIEHGNVFAGMAKETHKQKHHETAAEYYIRALAVCDKFISFIDDSSIKRSASMMVKADTRKWLLLAEMAAGPAGEQTFKAGELEDSLPLYQKHVRIADALGDFQLKARAENKVSNAAYWISQRWGNRPNLNLTTAFKLNDATSIKGTTQVATSLKGGVFRFK